MATRNRSGVPQKSKRGQQARAEDARNARKQVKSLNLTRRRSLFVLCVFFFISYHFLRKSVKSHKMDYLFRPVVWTAACSLQVNWLFMTSQLLRVQYLTDTIVYIYTAQLLSSVRKFASSIFHSTR